MTASLTLDKKGLDELVKRFEDPSLKADLDTIIMSKGIAALVGQAIADNFNKEGPGWQPLSPTSIRIAMSKKLGTGGKENSARKMLRKSDLLFQSVTTPGVRGNIWKQEGTKLIWGTDLVYAAIHNRGGTIHHPGTKNGFGRHIKIKPHNIKIPKREYLTIQKQWMDQIYEFFATKSISTLKKKLVGGR